MPRSSALGMGDHGFQRGAAHAVAPHDGMNERVREHLAKWWLEAGLAPRLAVVRRVKQFGGLAGHGSSLPEQPGPSAPAGGQSRPGAGRALWGGAAVAADKHMGSRPPARLGTQSET